MSLLAWLRRLTFSFFIVAFALFWRGQKQIQAGDESIRAYAWIVAAVISVVLGVIGLRLRHGASTRDSSLSDLQSGPTNRD